MCGKAIDAMVMSRITTVVAIITATVTIERARSDRGGSDPMSGLISRAP